MRFNPLIKWISITITIAFFSMATIYADKKKDQKDKEEPPKSPYAQAVSTPPAKGEKPVRVFTNEDLENIEPLGVPLPQVKESPSPQNSIIKEPDQAEQRDSDDLPNSEQSEARAANLSRKLAAAEANVLLWEERIKSLETRLLRIKNPLLPRPTIPEDEKEVWDSLDGAARAELTQTQLSEARKELEIAKAAYEAALRAR